MLRAKGQLAGPGQRNSLCCLNRGLSHSKPAGTRWVEVGGGGGGGGGRGRKSLRVYIAELSSGPSSV